MAVEWKTELDPETSFTPEGIYQSALKQKLTAQYAIRELAMIAAWRLDTQLMLSGTEVTLESNRQMQSMLNQLILEAAKHVDNLKAIERGLIEND